MLYSESDKTRKESYRVPLFASEEEQIRIPNYKLKDEPIEARIAYQLVKDELMDEGNARQNLATFCQTYMEPEATKLMSETLEKNAVDKSEYPQTAELENKCVNILADLWHAPSAEKYSGTSTVGSSEACMLGGLAMKFRWRKKAEERGLDIAKQRPNLVISSGYQVCWEKFCVYWDVDMRVVPMDEAHLRLNTDKVLDYVDEYTIGIIGILGITYTGEFDDIQALDKIVAGYNKTHDHELVIHIDGASGAMFAPFVEPDLKWDFQLDNVVSINTSGHKYGLVYPGVGWIIWRGEEYLPRELVFDVSYLGGSMPTMAINFSRSASQIIGQYYNFLRYGFSGYKKIHERTRDTALYLAKIVKETGYFDVIHEGANLPIVCYKMKADLDVEWTLYDLADQLLMKGWQVPAYPLPDNLSDTIVQRFVCRADLGYNVAEEFAKDFQEAIHNLEHARVLYHADKNQGTYGFTH